jgi:hypothetical protein
MVLFTKEYLPTSVLCFHPVCYKYTTCFGLRPSSSILIQKFSYEKNDHQVWIKKRAPFFNCRHVQKSHTMIGYVWKTQNFCENSYFRFLEGNGCVERGKICFLPHNQEVDCLLHMLMVFLFVGWHYKIQSIVLCCLSLDGSRSCLRE